MNIQIKQVSNYNGYKMFNVVNNNYGVPVIITLWPTLNCQTSSIANIQDISNYWSDQDKKDLFKLCKSTIKRKQFICEIKDEHYKKCKQELKPYIKSINSHKYTSTNKSVMRLCLLRLKD